MTSCAIAKSCLRESAESCSQCIHNAGVGDKNFYLLVSTSIDPIPAPPLVSRYESAGAETSNDGSTADYYQLPPDCNELQELISYRNMNAQLGEIFRAAYRYGQAHHSDRARDLRKIIFYAQAELDRLEKYPED